MSNTNYSNSSASTASVANIISTTQTSFASQVVVQWPNIIFSAICAFGMVTNAINIAVLSSPKLKDKVYTCMLVSCISEFFYLTIQGLGTVFQCGTACNKYFLTLPGLIYSFYLGAFLTSVLALFSILIEIFLSFQRYTILINRPFMVNTRLSLILSVLLIISFFVHIPTVTNNCIILLDASTQTYMFTSTSFGRTDAGKILKAVSNWSRVLLTLVVLTVLSIMTAVKSRDYFNKKANLSRALHPQTKSGKKYLFSKIPR